MTDWLNSIPNPVTPEDSPRLMSEATEDVLEVERVDLERVMLSLEAVTRPFQMTESRRLEQITCFLFLRDLLGLPVPTTLEELRKERNDA